MQNEAMRTPEHRPRLGRGLAALLADAQNSDISESPPGTKQRTAAIELVCVNPNNPRRDFNEDLLNELAESIKKRGIIQPLVVRALSEGQHSFEIIAGERRWRSAQRAGLHEVPIIVIEATERESLELAIIENVQRSDLNAIEEATGYAKLNSEHGYSHSDIAKIIGKSRSYVTNTLRLLKLPDFTRALIEAGKISAGHARALLTASDPDAIARKVVANNLSVREVESLEKDPEKIAFALSDDALKRQDINVRDLESSLTLAIGARVRLKSQGESGELRIYYSNLEQLDELVLQLTQSRSRCSPHPVGVNETAVGGSPGRRD